MNEMNVPEGTPWYGRASFGRVFWVTVGVIVLVEGVIAIAYRENDFNCHLAFGEHFLAGEPYRHAGNIYPPGRAMFNALPAAMNYYAARAVFYIASLGALAAALTFWLRMVPPPSRQGVSLKLPLVALTLGILFPIVLRDLDECGLHLLLLFLLSAGAYAYHRGRHAVCGVLLAAGATYKATPILFLPLLLWKREWKAAGWMASFLLVFNFVPAVHLGWQNTLAENRHWCRQSAHLIANRPEAYPSLPGIELPKQQNLSVKALLARFVESYPEGHTLHLSHPLFFQFGDLPPRQAKRVVMVLIVLLGAGIAWRFRKSWRTAGGANRMPVEWAVACLFCSLMSPQCWKQHLVVAIPVVLLVGRQLLSTASLPRSRTIAVAAAACVILLSRHGIVGRENSILLMSYKLDTMALLLFGGLAMFAPRAREAAVGASRDEDPPLKMAA